MGVCQCHWLCAAEPTTRFAHPCIITRVGCGLDCVIDSACAPLHVPWQSPPPFACPAAEANKIEASRFGAIHSLARMLDQREVRTCCAVRLCRCAHLVLWAPVAAQAATRSRAAVLDGPLPNWHASLRFLQPAAEAGSLVRMHGRLLRPDTLVRALEITLPLVRPTPSLPSARPLTCARHPRHRRRPPLRWATWQPTQQRPRA